MSFFRKITIRIADKFHLCLSCKKEIEINHPEVEISQFTARGWETKYYHPNCYPKIQDKNDPPLNSLSGAEKLTRSVQNLLPLS